MKRKIFRDETQPKATVGEIVGFQGDRYRVESVSYVSHPELLLGGSRSSPGFYYQLFPVDEDVEEVGGWVNEHRIKKLEKRR